MVFLEYSLEADTLYLGERPKGEIFKPCIKTIPFSQVTGALNRTFDRGDFKAIGHLDPAPGYNQQRYLIYSPRERVAGFSKVPLQVEYLVNVKGRVFILFNDAGRLLPEEFNLALGGMRSRGFGKSRLKLSKQHLQFITSKGFLLSRIPCDEAPTFHLEIIIPRYGYLFSPIPNTFTGYYLKAYFEDSLVTGPCFLIKPEEG